MLGGLARWLRAAGYDTALAAGEGHDRELVERCIDDGRILLTRDRQLALTARAAIPVLLLASHKLDEAARQLHEVLGVDWQHAPFTRCLLDNAVLAAAEPAHAEQVPPMSRQAGGPLRVCPACGRVYWPGGHVRRMQQRLAGWQSG